MQKTKNGIGKAMLTIWFAIAFLIAAHNANCQNVSGTIVGTVSDSTGAAIPGAKISITDTKTGVIHTVQSDSQGYYSAPNLPPGTYNVVAQSDGFSTENHNGVLLGVATTTRVDATLTPGSVTQSITVSSGETPVLQTDTAETGRDLGLEPIAELPLSTGRNFQSLLNTVPGAGYTTKQHSTFFNPQQSMSTTVNGNSSLYNTFDIEGINDNQRTNLEQIYIPPIEAIQEVHISTSNYDPQQGSALGAVTNVVLKSGGNDIHGEVYYFYTGNALQARSYFQTTPNHHAVDNYWGGNIGGPIIKKKLFYFASFLEHTQHLGEFYAVSVPTMAMRGGDFSDPTLAKIYDPTTGDTADCLPGGNVALCGTGRTQFSYNGVANVIPPNRLDPVATKLLAYVSAPNANVGASGKAQYTNNLQTSSLFTQNTPDIDAKIDWFLREKDHIAGRFSYEDPSLNQAGLFGVAGGPLSGGGIGGAEGNSNTKIFSTGINWVHQISSSFIAESRFGIARFHNLAYPTGYGQNLSEAAGIPGANVSQFTSGLVQVNGEGFSDPMLGGCSNCPWNRAGTIIEAVENVTKVKGNHTIGFGADYTRVRDDLLLVSNPAGNFSFTAGQTALNGGTSGGQANQFASFLLGIPSTVNRGFVNTFPAYRQNRLFLYGGDKWQVSGKLTLNMGLRWEYYGPPTPHETGGFSNYDPATNTLRLAGVGQVPRDLGVKPDYANWGPRVGIDYRISPKSVVRAGFGMSSASFPIDLYAYNYPIEPSVSYTTLSSYGPAILSDNTAASFAKGFPDLPVYVQPTTGIIQANTSTLLNQTYTHVNLNWKNPYLETWNLAFEQNLAGDWSLDVAYVGNRGVHVPILYNENAATQYGKGALGQPEYRPCVACGSPNANVGRTATTSEYFAGYSSNYNALQVKLDHKLLHGFAITNSYTYGKALGFVTESSDYPNGLLDYVNQRSNYAPPDFNQTHMFNQSYIWRLPIGTGSHLAANGVAGKILGGFQLSGDWSAMSGFPLNFSCTCSSFNTPGNQAFPNMSGSVRKLKGINTKPWFDTSRFSAPTVSGVQGNTGQYISQGPRFFNLDASVSRVITFTERLHLEMRSEWLHATNTPQFSNPNTQLGNSSFGLVTSVGGGSRIINVAGKLTF
jgi:hypothetical protein